MELLIVDDDGIGFDNRKIGTRGEYLEIVIIKKHIGIGIWRKMYKIIYWKIGMKNITFESVFVGKIIWNCG